jgi:2-amino-4-hydroxy-6-hydroxymethyldihydropteridine diphosphokinase
MFPVIDLGPFAIQASGLSLLLSLLIGFWLTGLFAKNLGTAGDVIENSVFYGLLAGIAAARVGFFLKNPVVFADAPLSLLSLSPTMFEPGFGLLVGGLTALIFAQKKQTPLWPTLDTLTPLMVFLYAGIQISDLAAGDHYGLPTTLPWGIQLWNEVRHPVQLYALLLLTILVVWMLIQTRGLKFTGFLRSGILFNIILAGLSSITLLTRAFVASKDLISRLDISQLFALLVLVTALIIIYVLLFKSQQRIEVMISLGSNLDPVHHLAAALNEIKKQFRIRLASSLYQTEGVRDAKQGMQFLNQVIEIETNLPYTELIAQLKQIEKELGRDPQNRKSIPIDLDIITYNKDVFTCNGHQIPDPDLQRYRYIAQPLAEISPTFRHPANGRSIKKILSSIGDKSQITKITEVENGLEE